MPLCYPRQLLMWQLGVCSIAMFGTTVAKPFLHLPGGRQRFDWMATPVYTVPKCPEPPGCERCSGPGRRLSVVRNTGSTMTISVVPLSSFSSVLLFNFPTGSSLPTPPGYEVTVRGFYLIWLMQVVDTRSNVIFVQLPAGTPAPCRLVAGARSRGKPGSAPGEVSRILLGSGGGGGGEFRPCEKPQGHVAKVSHGLDTARSSSSELRCRFVNKKA